MAEGQGAKLVRALAASYEDDAEGFVAVLERMATLDPSEQQADHVSAFVQNALIAHYHADDLEGAAMIVNGYAALIGTGFAHGEHHFEAVATSVSIAQLSGDDDTAAVVFEALVPRDRAEIQHARLAFNLACLASLRSEKERCLEFTALALALGKTADQFDDGDFDNMRGDADFQALLK